VQWINLSPEEATWEDANFIKSAFPDFYTVTIRSWFPEADPRGQGSSSAGGTCQDLEATDDAYMMYWQDYVKEESNAWDDATS
jgi:hypothetical protein